ncbi:unnamed protein product [Rhizoctonia solani]|uniref:Cyclin N-terminal domain-containing protein n=1 Tax=Rhizoctonia solani TaxID=456999 RepID=A0A8H2WJ53_9AGAM|nr:unnamed protein product [Rhizoctonia solani]
MTSTSARICANSLVPYHEHDEAIIRLLAMPVTDQMVHYFACKLTVAVGTPEPHHLPTPPVTPIRGRFALNSAPCSPEWEFPPLEVFLKDLASRSRIHTASVLGSLIYLKRITENLQSGTIKHGPETPYRLAVALFTVASKYSHDISPSTVHWAAYTAAALGISSLAESISRRCSNNTKVCKEKTGRKVDDVQLAESNSLGYLFGPDATAALERDILFLLNFNMGFNEEDLRGCLNGLSSHERAEGPLEQLRLGQGRPEPRPREKCSLFAKLTPAVMDGIDYGDGVVESSREILTIRPLITPGSQATTSLASPPCTPVRGILKQDYVIERSFPTTNDSKLKRRVKPSLEVDLSPQRAWIESNFLGPQSHTPYPQLNINMDTNYLSRLMDRAKHKNVIVPIGVPSAPPSTPTAGVKSLPFIYGGNVSSPVSPPAAMDDLIVAPDKDSPWTHGQVGEILRKTMAHQARQLASLTKKENQDITVLNTPSLVAVFGSGLLYKQDPDRSSIEPARMAKLTVSDLRWYYALKRPIPVEMLDGELSGELKGELLRLGIPIPEASHGGTTIDTATRRSHPVALALTLSPSAHVHPVLKATLDKRIYCHVRGRHYKAVIDSGPANLLNTPWDKKLQAELEAKGLGECEHQFKTTAPLRLVKKDTISRQVKHLDEHLSREGNKAVRQVDGSMVDRTVAELPDSKLGYTSVPSGHLNADRTAELQGLDAGFGFVPAPRGDSDRGPENIGWFSRLLGGSHRKHNNLIKD